MPPLDSTIEKAYQAASSRYAQLGVNVDAALRRLSALSISLHCWQGDDVQGFESSQHELGGGLAVTGNYPGCARTADELRCDLEQAMKLLPGRHRLNLHASYGEFRQPVDRDQIELTHYQGWIDWARGLGIGLDFNPTYFAHELARDGFTLSHHDRQIREFWIEHGVRSRRIGAEFGRQLNSACVTNVWIPDGMKDTPVDRLAPRQRLVESLDHLFAESFPREHQLDAVECKLFGLGSESYVVGSHEFYLGYALSRDKLLCLDAGHFHPTEIISDKISSVLLYLDQILLHVSRGVRWDSDHVVVLSDELLAIAQAIVRNESEQRVRIGLDFFDASINRVAAWVIGTRNMLKALLMALLEPHDRLREIELQGDYTQRLAIMEEMKCMPWSAIWDYYCLQQNAPPHMAWWADIESYEANVLRHRDGKRT